MEREAFALGKYLEPCDVPVGRLTLPPEVTEHCCVRLWMPLTMEVHQQHARGLYASSHCDDSKLGHFTSAVPPEEALRLVFGEDPMPFCVAFYFTYEVVVEPALEVLLEAVGSDADELC